MNEPDKCVGVLVVKSREIDHIDVEGLEDFEWITLPENQAVCAAVMREADIPELARRKGVNSVSISRPGVDWSEVPES